MTYRGDHQLRPCFGTFGISQHASGIPNQRLWSSPKRQESVPRSDTDRVIPPRLKPESQSSQTPICYHFKEIPTAALHRAHLPHDPWTDQAGTNEQRWTAFEQKRNQLCRFQQRERALQQMDCLAVCSFSEYLNALIFKNFVHNRNFCRLPLFNKHKPSAIYNAGHSFSLRTSYFNKILLTNLTSVFQTFQELLYRQRKAAYTYFQVNGLGAGSVWISIIKLPCTRI